MRVSKEKARQVGHFLGLDFRRYDLKMWTKGMNVELEHGKIHKKTNVTNNDLVMTGKIALAHILEFPTYYTELIKMEKKLKSKK